MSNKHFRRYTTLPFLLDILYWKRLPLLDPANWDDQNDAYFIRQYRDKKDLKSVLAICLANCEEKYHHWKIYAGNTSGVCIEFNQRILLNTIASDKRFVMRKVKYPLMDSLERDVPSIDNLPFIKRYAFRDEEEYRVIYEDCYKETIVEYISITPRDISRIVINPWVHESVIESIKSALCTIEGFENLKVAQSSILKNEKWRKIGSQAYALD